MTLLVYALTLACAHRGDVTDREPFRDHLRSRHSHRSDNDNKGTRPNPRLPGSPGTPSWVISGHETKERNTHTNGHVRDSRGLKGHV